MRKQRLMRVGLWLALVALLVSGCGSKAPAQSGDTPAPAPEVKQDPIKLTVAYPSVASPGDIASLVAWDLLKERGYDIATKFLAKPDLAAQAVANGDVDIGAVPVATGMQAVLAGADIRIFLEHKRNEWSLASTKAITSPKELDGKQVAIHSQSGQTAALMSWTEKEYQIAPHVSAIPGSEVRAQALLNGQIDATPLELSDSLNVMHAAPDKFQVLLAYSELFPDLNGTSFWATPEWLKDNPQVVADVIKANLEVRRRAKADPNWLVEEATRRLITLDAEQVERIVRAYIEKSIWDVNGNISPDTAAFTLDFYKESGQVQAESGQVTAEQFYAFAPLNQVLTEMGKS